VVARRDSSHLTLVVRDDGAGVPATGPAREGVGLSSTRARLAQLYGPDHNFSIVRGAEFGTVCTIRLPCREGEESSARWA
jgi:signal transduction histidine kinase